LLLKFNNTYSKKYFVAPDYTYLRCGMQYVHWLGYNVMLFHQSFEQQGKTIQGNISWHVFTVSC